jgi:hypothetical protein
VGAERVDLCGGVKDDGGGGAHVGIVAGGGLAVKRWAEYF